MTKINKKHPNSKFCFICGMKNDIGIKARFYSNEKNELIAYFTPDDMFQGYPERLHGGIAASILDEAIGRAINIDSPQVFGVTTDLKIKYRKPLPLNQELTVVCRLTRDTRMLFEGTGEIYTPDGEVAVSAEGRYMKLDVTKITDHDFGEGSQEWKVYPD
jgi:acyl-coenzyme A thioesterase PaaI-like protein